MCLAHYHDSFIHDASLSVPHRQGHSGPLADSVILGIG